MGFRFEDITDSIKQLQAQGILISKLQVSAALKITGIPTELEAFCDPVYLHQTRQRDARGGILAYPDLPAALKVPCASDTETRTHFHVPLYFEKQGNLSSTTDLLSRDFFQTVFQTGCHHVEIETYTYDVLPDAYKEYGIVRSICREYQWLLERMGR